MARRWHGLEGCSGLTPVYDWRSEPPQESELPRHGTGPPAFLLPQQMEDAIEFWQSESDESGPLPVVLDIGGGGHGVPNAIGQEGMQALVDVLVANREHVHVRCVLCVALLLWWRPLRPAACSPARLPACPAESSFRAPASVSGLSGRIRRSLATAGRWRSFG